MSVKLTEHHLEFLNLKDCSTGSSESTHIKMPYCWKSHATTQFIYIAGNTRSITLAMNSYLPTQEMFLI